MRAPRRHKGELASEVLASLARAHAPVTPAQVQADIPGDLAYTTVMTTLVRLTASGALTRTAVGRGYAYALAAPVQALGSHRAAHQMRRLLDGQRDRATVLRRFVAELKPGDEQILHDLLDGAHEHGDEPR
ncbi:MAG: BlaI/MecI/CopY family transcriptional regulator [Mycobacteriales bacterium]|nr:MAG: CopY family transcriptional regulator [Pseudonocardiales bacterium]